MAFTNSFKGVTSSGNDWRIGGGKFTRIASINAGWRTNENRAATNNVIPIIMTAETRTGRTIISTKQFLI